MTTEVKKLVTPESVNVFLQHTGCSTLEELNEKIDSEVLEWLRNEFPDKTVSLTLLDGSDGHGYNRIEYNHAITQDARCEACKKVRGYDRWFAGNCFMWHVKATDNGRFQTYFYNCPTRSTAIRDKEKRRQQGTEASPIKLFSGKQGG